MDEIYFLSRKGGVGLKGDYLESGEFFALAWNFYIKDKNILQDFEGFFLKKSYIIFCICM